MRWLWVTVFLTVVLWLQSLPVFTAPSGRWAWIVAVAILAAVAYPV